MTHDHDEHETTMPTVSNTPDVCETLPASLQERDDLIAFRYFILGQQQKDIAPDYDLTQQGISHVIAKYRKTEAFQNRLVQYWEKEMALIARSKAFQVCQSINPEKIPDGSKATTVGILIDKARLIAGQSTENITFLQIAATYEEIKLQRKRLEAELGMEERTIDMTPLQGRRQGSLREPDSKVPAGGNGAKGEYSDNPTP